MSYEKITSKKLLANFLRCDLSFLEQLVSRDYFVLDPLTPSGAFSKEDIVIQKLYLKKKGRLGGYREVYAIRDFQLANTLKILNNELSKSFSPEECVHGFVSGKSIKTNASKHLARKEVLSIDIKNFFDAISGEQVKNILIIHTFPEQSAEWLSKITTFDNHLVQGFHSSPTIANMVFDTLDKELTKFCGDQVHYTRYADDLYFSTDNSLPDIDKIVAIINKGGFEINEKKTSIMKRGKRQYVTGLTVFDTNLPRISRLTKRNLRLEIHYVHKFGFRNHAIKRLMKTDENFDKKDETRIQLEISEIHNRLRGWVDFMNSIEPLRARQLHDKLIRAKP